jgi:hypothetical protein
MGIARSEAALIQAYMSRIFMNNETVANIYENVK